MNLLDLSIAGRRVVSLAAYHRALVLYVARFSRPFLVRW